MFNWFQRSSKSESGKRHPRAAGRPAAFAGAVAARRATAGLVPACDPQALARLCASARQLSPGAQRILAALPSSVCLRSSCIGFPQAVEKLLGTWRNPRDFRMTLDSMVMDSRGGRQGFPFEVVAEFSALREYYDRCIDPVRADAWETVDSR